MSMYRYMCNTPLTRLLKIDLIRVVTTYKLKQQKILNNFIKINYLHL